MALGGRNWAIQKDGTYTEHNVPLSDEDDPRLTTTTIWMVRFNEDDNCDGDPVGLFFSKESAEADAAKLGPHCHIEPWPVLP